MSHLDRTAAILDIVETAANSGQLPGPTQSFLAQYLAVVLYSEMEERVAEIVKGHLECFTHEAVANFVTSSMGDLIRRVPKSDIAKLAERFGEAFKTRFNGSVEEHKVTFYSNVISARHEIGHRRGSNISLSEVKKGHEAANHILDTLANCLAANEPASDIASGLSNSDVTLG